MKILDNEQIRDARDTAELAAETFNLIGLNYEPYGALIASAAADAGTLFFAALGDNLVDHNPHLAQLAYDTVESLQAIIEEEPLECKDLLTQKP